MWDDRPARSKASIIAGIFIFAVIFALAILS